MTQQTITARFKAHRIWLTLLLLVCLLVTIRPAHSENIRVQLIYNNAEKTHQRYVERLKSELARKVADISFIETSASQLLRNNSLAGADYYISIGVDAAALIQSAALQKPVLFALLPVQHVPPNSSQLADTCQSDCIYSVLDQPIKRQLTLLKYALPGFNNIGVLYTDNSAALIKPLTELANGNRLDLLAVRQSPEQSLQETLDPILTNTQLLLALPDPEVYNRQTARSIILLTYRHRIPIFGYSDAYTRAGALLSLYSSPEHFAQHNAELLSDMIGGQKIPHRIVYPRYFSVSVNQTVARSLDIDLDNAASLTDWLRKHDDYNANH